MAKSNGKPGTSNSYVCTMRPDQIRALRAYLQRDNWVLDDLPYAHWRARKDKTTAVAYESGKVTVQGKGTADLVQFIIEPEITGEVRFGYEDVLAAEERPEMLTPHAGIDESGKGDYFGPLVIAAAYVDAESAQALLEEGVADSKTIKSDRRIAALASAVRTRTRGRFAVVAIGPEAYNRLYGKFRNVNRLLAWGHARALENLLDKVPDCPRAISDQFGDRKLVERALFEKGKSVTLEQMPKAEADIAVAAASILARAEFVRRLESLGRQTGVTLPKGAGTGVDAVATDLARKGGTELLQTVAKLHFRTTEKVMGGI